MSEGAEKGIWRETRGTEEIEAERRREESERAELEKGLARCSVCNGAAKIVEFGLEGNGVWIGCDRTEECSRYIEIHTEGWSIREVAEEWNRNNRGVNLVIRRVKRWFRERFGEEKRREKRKKREFLAKKRVEETKMREIFGISEGKKEGFWGKLLAKRQKVAEVHPPERKNEEEKR